MLERPTENRSAQSKQPASDLASVSLPKALPPPPAVEVKELAISFEGQHFNCQIFGTLEGPLKARGGGTIRLAIVDSAGSALATYSSKPDALTPLVLQHLQQLCEAKHTPEITLRSCLHFLESTAGVSLFAQPLKTPPPTHPELPGASMIVPSLSNFVAQPSSIRDSFTVTRTNARLEQESLLGELRSDEGLILLRLEGWKDGEPLTRCFRVISPATRNLCGEPLRKHLLELARFVLAEFERGGVEDVLQQLAELKPPAYELPADENEALVTESEILWSCLPPNLSQRRLNEGTGTATKLFLGLNKAGIIITPNDELQGNSIEPLILFANNSNSGPAMLTDVQLEFITKCFERLSSDRWSERALGLDMVFSGSYNRLGNLDPTLPGKPGEQINPRLRRDLNSLSIKLSQRTVNFLSAIPRNVLRETTVHPWVILEGDEPNSRAAVGDALESRVSRRYTFSSQQVQWRPELLQSMRLTRRADGSTSVCAETQFGGRIVAQLPNTTGLTHDEVDQREAKLVRAFAKQRFGSWLELQREIEGQMYGEDVIEKSELGVWDETLIGLPPLSDAQGIGALALATKIVREAMYLESPSRTAFRAARLAPGLVVLLVEENHGTMFMELHLSGEVLREIRFGRGEFHQNSLARAGYGPSTGTTKPLPPRFLPAAPLHLTEEVQCYLSQLVREQHDSRVSIPRRGNTTPIFHASLLTQFFADTFHEVTG